jgi:enoyl-CoA hydratase/carnithine racemase
MFEVIQIDRRAATAWLRLRRPQVLNALSPDLVAELGVALDQLEVDETVRVVALTGSGRAFCAGADLSRVLEEVDAPERVLAFVGRIAALVERLAVFPKPVIAAVNGLALAGGLELVLACDLVIAAEGARLGDAHANYGLLPGAGGAARLPRRLGVNRAKYLLFTGEALPASELVAAGLVNRVVADAELEPTVDKLAEVLAAKSPLGLRAMKRLVDDGLEQPLASALRLERLELRAHLHTADMREGLVAFRQKRPPRFGGP